MIIDMDVVHNPNARTARRIDLLTYPERHQGLWRNLIYPENYYLVNQDDDVIVINTESIDDEAGVFGDAIPSDRNDNQVQFVSHLNELRITVDQV